MEDLGSGSGPVRGRRPGRAWVSVAHGLYSGGTETLDILRAWQLLLPSDGCFTHLTAMSIRGWWLPPLPDDLPVVVAMGRRGARPLRTGIRTIRPARAAPHEIVDGLRVASAVDTLFACARDLGLIDLVVIIDGALYAGDVTLEELLEAAQARRPGALALREALRWADPRSESAWETLLRIFHKVCDIEV